MVAHDIFQTRGSRVSGQSVHVEKALPALGVLAPPRRRMPSISQASFSAFTMVSLALPGCTETPVMRNTADAALKFS